MALKTGVRGQAIAAAMLLLAYWALMMLVPVPGVGAGDLTPDGNLAAYLDRLVFGSHIWRDNWDPEGLLSTLPAVATTLLGLLTGRFLRSGRDKAEITAWMRSVWGEPGSEGFFWARSQWHAILSISGEHVSHAGLLRRTIRVGSREITVGGVSAVTTRPAWRHNGYSTRLLRHVEGTLRSELDIPFALLECEPRMVSFYRRLCWNALPETASCELPNGPGPVPGHVTMLLRLTDEEWPEGPIDLLGKPW